MNPNFNVNEKIKSKCITPLKLNRLVSDTVEAIECLKWWIKGGLIKGVLKSLITNENEDLMDKEEDLMDEEEDWYS